MVNRSRLLRRGGIAVGLTVLVCIAATYVTLLLTGKVHIEQSDLLVYYSASHVVLDGHGGAIYELARLKAVEASALHSLLLPRTEAVFLYPPFVAVALAPFAIFGYSATFVIWLLVNCALLALVLRELVRYLDLRGTNAVLFGIVCTSFFPVTATLLQGQVSILLLAALSGVFFSLLSGRETTAGLLLALALLKPPYVIPFLAVLVIQRRWRSLVAFGLAAVGLAVVPMAFLGVRTDLQYLNLLRAASSWHTTSGGFSPQANENLWGFFHLLLPAYIAAVPQLLLSAVALAAVGWLALRSGKSVELPFAAAAIAALLINPHVLIHDLALVLLPVTIGLLHLSGRILAFSLVAASGYAAALFSVPLALSIHIQALVFVMAALLVWFVRQQSWAGRKLECRWLLAS